MPHVDRCPKCDCNLEYRAGGDFVVEGEGFETWGCRLCDRTFTLQAGIWPEWFYRTFEEDRDNWNALTWGHYQKIPKPAALRAREAQAMGEIAVSERDEALATVDAGVDPVWKMNALNALKRLAIDRPEFCADDLWDVIGQPREPRAAGPVFRRAASEGFIRKSTRYVRSRRRHATDIVVWESMVYGNRAQSGLDV